MVQKWYDEVNDRRIGCEFRDHFYFLDLKNLILKYFQVKDITAQAVDSFSLDKTVTGATGDIGHYTQVVWAETTDVGCGYMTSNVNERIESVRNNKYRCELGKIFKPLIYLTDISLLKLLPNAFRYSFATMGLQEIG